MTRRNWIIAAVIGAVIFFNPVASGHFVHEAVTAALTFVHNM